MIEGSGRQGVITRCVESREYGKELSRFLACFFLGPQPFVVLRICNAGLKNGGMMVDSCALRVVRIFGRDCQRHHHQHRCHYHDCSSLRKPLCSKTVSFSQTESFMMVPPASTCQVCSALIKIQAVCSLVRGLDSLPPDK
jgi:hypothetical protein